MERKIMGIACSGMALTIAAGLIHNHHYPMGAMFLFITLILLIFFFGDKE